MATILKIKGGNVMVDIETLGNGKDAAIVSIGAARFSLRGDGPDETFLTNIDFADAMKFGRVDGNTLKWWFQQSRAAQDGIMNNPNAPPVTLERALIDFRTFYGKSKQLWSHATFDAVILEYAYRRRAMTQPWHYRETKDIRTLNFIHNMVCGKKGTTRSRADTSVAHSALDDAVYQVAYVQDMWKAMMAVRDKANGGI